MITLLLFLASGCGTDLPNDFPPCAGSNEREVDLDDPTPHGDTARAILDELADFERDVIVNNDGSEFADTFHYRFDSARPPRRMQLSASGLEAWCVDADMLIIDVEIEMTSALGLNLEGGGRVFVDAVTGEHRMSLSLTGDPSAQDYAEVENTCSPGDVLQVTVGVNADEVMTGPMSSAPHDGFSGIAIDTGRSRCSSDGATWSTTD